MRLSSALTVLSLIAGATAAGSAAPVPVEDPLGRAIAAVQKVALAGPRQAELVHEAVLNVPAGDAIIPSPQADAFMAALGNARNPARVAVIVPQGANPHWLIDISWVHDGYVRDADARDWQAAAMLANLRQATEKQNAARVAHGLPPVEITGWAEPPTYHSDGHQLVWALAAHSRGAAPGQPQAINYNAFALGRHGYFTLDLVTTAQNLSADKLVANNVLASLHYRLGRQYEDFDGSTDKVADYGLSALVGMVSPARLGILAVVAALVLNSWKLGLFVVLGGWAAIKRLARRLTRRASPDAAAWVAAQG